METIKKIGGRFYKCIKCNKLYLADGETRPGTCGKCKSLVKELIPMDIENSTGHWGECG